VTLSNSTLADFAGEEMRVTSVEGLHDRVLDVVRKACQGGYATDGRDVEPKLVKLGWAPHSMVFRRTKNVRKFEFRDAIESLIEKGELEVLLYERIPGDKRSITRAYQVVEV
jgi:hypothetical protein